MATATTTATIEMHTDIARLMNHSIKRGEWKPTTLEAVQQKHQQLMDLTNPQDRTWRGKDLHFQFDGRVGVIRAISEPTTEYRLTKLATSQLASAALPSRGMAFIRDFANLAPLKDEEDGAVRLMAEGLVNRFLRAHKEPMKIRTIQHPDEGPVIRAFLSQKYTPLDNGSVIKNLIEVVGKDAPVLSAVIETDVSRFRLALDIPTDPGSPIPMIEVWNSEVGTRSLGIDAGAFRLVCTNGMRAFQADTKYRWNHVGFEGRIKAGMRDALVNSRQEAKGVIAAYEKALVTHIGDVWGFVAALPKALPSSLALTEGQATNIRAALGAGSTHQDGSIAQIVDAITLAAQDSKHIETQRDMEAVAGFIAEKNSVKPPRLTRDRKGTALIEW